MQVRVLGSSSWVACLVATAFLGSVAPAAPAARKAALRVEVQPGVLVGWSVREASIEEDARDLWVDLTLQNELDSPVAHGTFYAEFSDDQGRLCFSALFDLGRNLGHQSGAVEPGGVRTLSSISGGLSTATVPRTIRVFPVEGVPVGSPQPFTAPVPIRIPGTLQATSVPARPDWQRLWLGALAEDFDSPVLDLAMAEADVDPGGELTEARILQARDPAIAAWVDQLVARLLFRPAELDFRPQQSRIAILVRVLVRAWKPSEPPYEPGASPWVQDYVRGLNGPDVPPVNVLVLYPCPTEGSDEPRFMLGVPHAIPDCVEYGGTGTGWSIGIWEPPPYRPKPR